LHKRANVASLTAYARNRGDDKSGEALSLRGHALTAI